MPFVVRLDAASGRTVTVQYATANVTATAGRDYTRVSGTLTFGAGTTVRTVTVPIADDALDEHDSEQFTVTLLAAVNAHGKHRTRNRDNRRQRPGTGVEHRGQRTDRGRG